MDTIIYNGKKYNRNPESKRRQHRLYYWRHDKWKEAPVSLHRQIWIDNNGPIPEKYIIHHKDRNTLNNSIDNLELMSPQDHSIHHMKERKVEKIGTCERCNTQFSYFSIRKAKFCSSKCCSDARHDKDRQKRLELN